MLDCNFIRNRLNKVLFCEIFSNFKNIFLTEHLW